VRARRERASAWTYIFIKPIYTDVVWVNRAM